MKIVPKFKTRALTDFDMAPMKCSYLNQFIVRLSVVTISLLHLFYWAEPSQAAGPCRLLVGYEQDKPFHYRDSAGAVIGIDAEFLTTVLSDIGCSVEFVEGPWARTVKEIQDGQLDVTMGASLKAERKKFAHYSHTYRGQPHVLAVKRDSPIKAQSLKAFLDAGHKLGVVIGWHYTDRLRLLLDDPKYQANIVAVPKFGLLPKMHEYGRVDGMLTNPTVLASVVGSTAIEQKYRLYRQDVDKLHFIFSKIRVAKDLVDRFNIKLNSRINRGKFMSTCRKFENFLIARCSFLAPSPVVN